MPELSKEEVVRTYKRIVDENDGRAIGERVFMRETSTSRYYWSGGYWRSWSAFQTHCGFEPNNPNEKTPDEIILKRFAELVMELEKIPTEADLMIKRRKDPSFPSKSTYRRWGSRDALIEKATKFCQDHEEFYDSLNILNEGTSKKAATRLTSKNVKGFVYLIRSGKNYKIGRTNAIGRRLNELSIQLPQKPDTVHVIETDDSEGIEQYWHKRFAEKRQGGEWFSLTKDDINAFKIRTFQ